MRILFLFVVISSFLLSDNNQMIETKLLICENNQELYIYLITALTAAFTYLVKTHLSLVKENSDNKALVKLSKEMDNIKVAIKKNVKANV